MKRIITIQHTQSQQHINKMIGSLADWDLTELGIKQADCIGKKLAEEIGKDKFILYSSDLTRAKHTSELIASHLGIVPIYTEALREFDLGGAIGHSKEWARNNRKCGVFPDTVDWAQSVYERPFDNAETKAEVWERVSAFLNQIMSNDEDDIIIVSHDGTLSILFAIWLNFDIEQLNKSNISGKTSGVSFLIEDDNGNRIISRLNDMSYSLV